MALTKCHFVFISTWNKYKICYTLKLEIPYDFVNFFGQRNQCFDACKGKSLCLFFILFTKSRTQDGTQKSMKKEE